MKQVAGSNSLLAGIGSLSLELTRFSRLTRDPRWYDAIAKITDLLDHHQIRTNVPILWPFVVDTHYQDFHGGEDVSIGGMADSAYEYLPKMHALLGGSKQYEKIYERSAEAIIQKALFQPMTPDGADILITGKLHVFDSDHVSLRPEGEHLVCFAGGMFALGGRLMGNETRVEIGRKLTDGYIWTYKVLPLVIMPEDFSMVPYESWEPCTWNQSVWHEGVRERAIPFAKEPHSRRDEEMTSRRPPPVVKIKLAISTGTPASISQNASQIIENQRLPPGFTSIADPHYILRPEAIESIFVLYRRRSRAKRRSMADVRQYH